MGARVRLGDLRNRVIFSLGGGLKSGISPAILNKSTVHWDWTVLQPKIVLDDAVFVERGRIFCE